MMRAIAAGQTVQIIVDDAYDTHQHLEFELARDSSLELIVLLRGIIPELSISVRLIGENAQAHIKGLYILRDVQAVTFKTQQIHQASHTTSSCTIKGIMYDSAYAHYHGTIYVAPQAHYTQARQANKNILLSASARAVSVPSLEVLTKHVHCSHGSAVGSVDKESIIYMQSRGLSAEQAQLLLLQGFAAEIIDAMPSSMVEQVRELIR